MKNANLKYECKVSFGSYRDRLPLMWVKSAEFMGDSVVINLSPTPVLVSYDLAEGASRILLRADNRPSKKLCVSMSEVTEHDAAFSKIDSGIDEFVKVLKQDPCKRKAFFDLYEQFISEEVSGDA